MNSNLYIFTCLYDTYRFRLHNNLMNTSYLTTRIKRSNTHSNCTNIRIRVCVRTIIDSYF
jgi:hypothetical protein